MYADVQKLKSFTFSIASYQNASQELTESYLKRYPDSDEQPDNRKLGGLIAASEWRHKIAQSLMSFDLGICNTSVEEPVFYRNNAKNGALTLDGVVKFEICTTQMRKDVPEGR